MRGVAAGRLDLVVLLVLVGPAGMGPTPAVVRSLPTAGRVIFPGARVGRLAAEGVVFEGVVTATGLLGAGLLLASLLAAAFLSATT